MKLPAWGSVSTSFLEGRELNYTDSPFRNHSMSVHRSSMLVHRTYIERSMPSLHRISEEPCVIALSTVQHAFMTQNYRSIVDIVA